MNTFKDDYDFGFLSFYNSTDDEDRKQGIDGWIGEIPVATRKFRVSIKVYGDISIRRRINNKSEYEKIVNGEYKPVLYIFEYTDAYLICRIVDIAQCLLDLDYIEIPNKDNATSGLYIDIERLPHLIIDKEAPCP